MAYIQRAYKNPQKQNAAINIKNKNCIIIARRESTMRLSLNVTKAKLMVIDNQMGRRRDD
jgi:hypothetical protein